MKKFLVLSLCACFAFLLSCKKEEKVFSLSFSSDKAVRTAQGLQFSLKSDYQGASAVELALQFSGTAKKDVDYKVSTEKFVLSKEKSIRTVTISPMTFGSDKTITITLANPPQGFKLGAISSVTFSLKEKLGVLSFKEERKVVYKQETAESVAILLFDKQAKALASPAKFKLNVEVDPASTAIEGENFELLNKDDLYFEPASSEALLQIKVKEYVASKNKLILRLAENAAYDLGANARLEVILQSDKVAGLSAKWKLVEISPDKEAFKNVWGLDLAAVEGYPILTEGQDNFLTLDMNTLTLLPDFKNELKNYFISACSIVEDGTWTYRAIGTKKIVKRYSLDKVNRFFHASEQSEDQQAYIALDLEQDQEQNEFLALYIIDYKSKSFNFVYFNNIYHSEKPVATDDGVYIKLRFQKVV